MQPHDSSAGPVSDTEELESRIEQAMELYLGQLESGEHPDREAFLAKFPDIAEELEGQLEALEFLHEATPELLDQDSGATSPTGDLTSRATLGDFRLIRPIGRGGMGVVYKAVQLSLDRHVAVKVLPFAAMMDTRQRKRFQNEARAAATLEHPNIVPIHFVGQDRGVHFYAMQLIEGQSLAELIRGLKSSNDLTGVSLDDAQETTRRHTTRAGASISTQRTHSRREFYRSVAMLGIDVARAIEHAHEQGVVHRDIKPGNLLLDEEGKVWVTDFGLARLEKNDTITAHGDILGTAAYMSPEHLSGSHLVDARSDVYSLAATLYELATLQQAFTTNDASSHLKVEDREPIALQIIDPQIPVDLETIILKAMSSDPRDRYQSAAVFAEDLQNFAQGQTIQARRPSSTDRIAKWARRHQSLATVAAVSVVLLCAVLALSTALVANAQRETKQALSESEKHAEQVEDLLYLADLQLAYQAWDNGRSDLVSPILDRQLPEPDGPDRRGFEWYALDSVTRPPVPQIIGRHDGGCNQLAVFPDGRRVASVGEDKKLRIWNLQTSESLAVIEMGDSSEEPLFSLAISPNGKTIATGSDCVQLWDVESGERKMLLTSFDYNVQSVAFSPDGKRIAAASRYDRVRVFLTDGEFVGEIRDSSRHRSLEFTPDSRRLLVPSRRSTALHEREGFIRVWDADLSQVELDIFTESIHFKSFTLATSSQDGRFYVVGEGGAVAPIRVCDAETGVQLLQLSQQGDSLRSIALSPNNTLAVGYANGTVAVWRLKLGIDGTLAEPSHKWLIRCHDGEVTSARFVSDSQLLTSGTDGVLKRWILPFATDLSPKDYPSVSSVEIVPAGQSVAWTGDKLFCLMQADGKVLVKKQYVQPNSVAISPDSKLAAVSDMEQNRLDVLEIPTGRLVNTITTKAAPEDVRFAPDGSELAVFDGLGDVTFWTTNTWKRLAEVSIDGEKDARAYEGVYSPDGKFLVCGGEFDDVAVVEIATRNIVKRIPVVSTTQGLNFDSSGSMLATAHDNGSIHIWNWPELTLRGTLTGHDGCVINVVFAPDGTIVSVSDDGTMRLWSAKNMREFGVLERVEHPLTGVALSPDGRLLCLTHNMPGVSQPNLVLFRLNRIRPPQ